MGIGMRMSMCVDMFVGMCGKAPFTDMRMSVSLGGPLKHSHYLRSYGLCSYGPCSYGFWSRHAVPCARELSA